jgi:hypothetical protein
MNTLAVLFSALGPLLYVISLTGLFVYIFRKKYNFQTLLPLALMSTVLFVFIFTLIFHNINLSFWLSVAASSVFLPLLIFDKQRKKVLKENIFTPGFVLFIILYIFIFALNWGKFIPLLSDSSMHWAPHVLAMWLQNDFYTSPGSSIVIHGDYPPMLQLFEVIWGKAAGMYSENLLFVALQLFSFSMILPAFSGLKWKKDKLLQAWTLIGLFAISILSLPLVFYLSGFYSTIEIDTALAFIFAYGIYLAITESKKFRIESIVILSIFVSFFWLTKQIAPLFIGLVIAIYIVSLWASRQESVRTTIHALYSKIATRKSILRWKTLIIIICIILPISLVKLWGVQTNGYLSPDPGVAIFHLDANDIATLPDIIDSEAGSSAQQGFAKNFIKHIMFDPGGFILNHLGSVSYLQIAILFAGGMLLLIYIRFKRRSDTKTLLIVTIILTSGWFAYCLALYLIFMFGGMTDKELINIDTSNRYLRTYLLALLLILAIVLFQDIISSYRKNTGTRTLIYFAATLMIIFGLFFSKATLKEFGFHVTNEQREIMRSLNIAQTKLALERINKVANSSFEKPTKILVTASTDDVRHYLQYNALPSRISLLLPEKNESNEMICNTIRKYDYFVVGYDHLDKDKWAAIKACVDNEVDYSLNSTYKVQIDGSRTSLTEVTPRTP